MTLITFTHFKIDPSTADEVVARRNTLVAAVRAVNPGLLDTRLVKLDEETWMDQWRWDSPASYQAAAERAHSMAEVEAAFALLRDISSETAELVDER